MLRLKVAFFAAGMLLCGTINTIAVKFQDIVVVGRAEDGTALTFKHPAVQSTFMFLGECLCLIPYFYLRWRRRRAKRQDPAYRPVPREEKMARRVARIMAFALPALCDAVGTTLMNVGLFFTYASVYQMLRGTLVLFAGAFTVLILRRRLFSHHWLGMVLITAGAALVGASSIIYAQEDAAAPDANRGLAAVQRRLWAALVRGGGGGDDGGTSSVAGAPLFGDILVVCAQAFNALQFILEEKYLAQYKVPALLAVGIEGCWGFALCLLALPFLSYFKGGDGLPVDDPVAAAREMAAHGQLAAAVGISVVSIACFNFFGISVTKSLSGAARATIDACRTLFIWLVCIRLGWERFHALQILGFVVLICGSALYNEILRSCLPGGGSGGGGGPDGDAALAAAARDAGRRGGRPHGGAGGRPHGGGRGAAAAGDEEAGGDLTRPLLQVPDGQQVQAGGLSQLLAGQLASPTRPIDAAPGTGPSHAAAAAGARRGVPGRAGEPRSSPGSEDVFVFARSMRLGPGALFPSSLGGSVPPFFEGEGSPYTASQGGSYYSYGPSSYGAGLLGGYTSGGETPPAGGAYLADDESDASPLGRTSSAGGAPGLRGGGALLPSQGLRPGSAGGGGGGRRGGGGGGRGGLAAAMRRGGSGSALADAAVQAQQQQQDGAGGSGAGRPPLGPLPGGPRPSSSSGGGAAAPPRG